MLTTTIHHGDLVIDWQSDESLRIIRQSNGQAIELSCSEWAYIMRAAELHDWPVAPPLGPKISLGQAAGSGPLYKPG
jgi:hypothetical protein